MVGSFEHLSLVRWDAPHSEFPSGGAEKWVAQSMVRLPGEGGGDGVGLIVSGAGWPVVGPGSRPWVPSGVTRESGSGRPRIPSRTTGLAPLLLLQPT